MTQPTELPGVPPAIRCNCGGTFRLTPFGWRFACLDCDRTLAQGGYAALSACPRCYAAVEGATAECAECVSDPETNA